MRPSLEPERQAEMLEALAACIAEMGINGLTVQAVADKSGWSRGHVRHYLGNKGDQLHALVDLYTQRYAASLEEIVEQNPRGQRRQAIFDELFGESWQNVDSQDDAVLDALTAYAASNPASGISLTPMYLRICAAIETAAQEEFGAAEARIRAEAALSLAYGASSMARISVMTQESSTRMAKEILGL